MNTTSGKRILKKTDSQENDRDIKIIQQGKSSAKLHTLHTTNRI